MANLPANSPALCVGEDPLVDGCSGRFPRKTEIGLCHKCAAIKQKPENTERYKTENFVVEQALPQCLGCGAVGANLVPPFCVGCQVEMSQTNNTQPMGPPQLAYPATGTKLTSPSPSAAVAAAQLNQMRQDFGSRMKAGKEKAAAQAGFESFDTTTSSGDILAFRNNKIGSTLSARTITVNCFAAANGKVLHEFPADMWTFNDTDMMDDVKAKFFELLCTRWEQSAPGKLQGDEVSLTWPDNYGIDLNVIHENIAKVYDLYINMPGFDKRNFASMQDRGKKNYNPNSKKGSVGQYLNFWLLINASKVEERYGCSLPARLGGAATRKRKFDNEDRTMAAPPSSKRPEPPVSVFRNSSALLTTRHASRSALSQNIDVKLVQGEYCMERNEIEYSNDQPLSACISITPLATGLEKTVFHGSLNASERYVFKRITDQTLNTLEDNNLALESEYKLLHIGQGLLTEFNSHCRNAGLDYTSDFLFSSAILAQEVVVDKPSLPSGLHSEELFSDATTNITWLLEPRRSTEVIKYSGTLAPVDRNTLPFMTMAAFAHYTYHAMDANLVLVDLQGSRTRDGVVLFDPMAHTSDGASCTDDLGPDGIAHFKENHTCNRICRGINLEPFNEEVIATAPAPTKRNGHNNRSRKRPSGAQRRTSERSRSRAESPLLSGDDDGTNSSGVTADPSHGG
ncbi:hypothetical protein V5O48_015326 [Marasmius crinis-equi]|uniref:Alpha-type protein kinase domain-containing protein n=1 Tax=Marasmius crinis-equi TaxID=585013 RepID=A0ABR3EUU5_9AGAR